MKFSINESAYWRAATQQRAAARRVAKNGVPVMGDFENEAAIAWLNQLIAAWLFVAVILFCFAGYFLTGGKTQSIALFILGLIDLVGAGRIVARRMALKRALIR